MRKADPVFAVVRPDEAVRFSRYRGSVLVNGLSTLLADPHAYEPPQAPTTPAPIAALIRTDAGQCVRVQTLIR
jgi:hypothetical protein